MRGEANNIKAGPSRTALRRMKKIIFITILFFGFPLIANGATEFVSKIAPDGDYYQLSAWESTVQTDLAATTTRVFSGAGTGSLSQGDTVTISSATVHNGVEAIVVATTSDQILVESATSSEAVILNDGDTLEKDASSYWTVSGAGDELGDTAIAVAECYKGDYSTVGTGGVNYIEDNVTIDGWTTGASNYIKVYTPQSERHNGVAGSGFRLNDKLELLELRENDIIIQGIEFDQSTTFNHEIIDVYGGLSNITVEQNIVHDTGGHCIKAYAWGGFGTIRNNIIYNCGHNSDRSAISVQKAVDNIYNNTIYDSERGISIGDTVKNLKNNMVMGSTDHDFSIGVSPNSVSHNISSDATAPGDNSITNVSLDDIGFVSTTDGSEDFHISFDSVAKDSGVDLSSTFTTDIDGETRDLDGQGWDIGADEANLDFVSKIKPSSESDSDYTKLSTWEDAIESDLTASTSRVMKVSDRGSYDSDTDDGSQITFSNGETGTLIHINSDNFVYATTTTNDLETGTVTISGSSHTFTISDLGTQIGRAIAEAYKGDYSADGGGVNYIADHVAIDGWTTGENNYVKVYTPTDERHTGVLKSGGDYTGFTVVDGAHYISLIRLYNEYSVVEGISLDCINGYKVYREIQIVSAHHSVIDSNLLANNDAYSSKSALSISGNYVRVINNLIYSAGATGLSIDDFGSQEIYNNTVSDCGSYGFYEDTAYTSYILKNNVSYNNTTADFGGLTSEATIDYNASSDGTADDFGGTGNIVNISDPFNDAANNDYSLASDSTDVSGQGIGPNSDSDVPDEDIIGTSRSGNTCDIGADEFPPAAKFRVKGQIKIKGNVKFK